MGNSSRNLPKKKIYFKITLFSQKILEMRNILKFGTEYQIISNH